MKKILSLIILLVFMVSFSQAQNKVTFSLGNKKISGGICAYTVYATVPVGQTWHVGGCNIRVTFGGNPSGCLTVHADSPADSANPNISGANGYQTMTTTPINGGVAIGLNILTFNTTGFYGFVGSTTPYRLGRIRFNITGSFWADTMHFRNSPTIFPTVVYDSLVQLVYNTTYQTIDPLVTGVEGNITTTPTEYQLYQNYPNPFNPTTTIKYDVPKSSFVKIKIYDVTGKIITELVNRDMEAGSYEVNWNAAEYASGIYFYRLESKDFSKVMRMVLIK